MSNYIHRFKVFHDVVFGSTSWFVLFVVQDLVAFIATAAPTTQADGCWALPMLFPCTWSHVQLIGKANTIAIPIRYFVLHVVSHIEAMKFLMSSNITSIGDSRCIFSFAMA